MTLFIGESAKKLVLLMIVMIQLLMFLREMIKCASSVLKNLIKQEKLLDMAISAAGKKMAVLTLLTCNSVPTDSIIAQLICTLIGL